MTVKTGEYMKHSAYSAIFAAMMLPVAVSAQDSNWVEIGDSNTNVLTVDPSTIKTVSGSIRSAWFQFTKKPTSSTTIYSTKQMTRINCDEETTATVPFVSYNAKGDVISSHTTPIVLLSYEPAPPGTLAATMVKVVCNF